MVARVTLLASKEEGSKVDESRKISALDFRHTVNSSEVGDEDKVQEA